MNVYYHKTKYGKSPADGDIEKYVTEHINLNKNIRTSSELVIDCVRANIIRGNISHNNVRIFFEQGNDEIQELEINEYAVMIVWPKEFCSMASNLAYEIIRGAMKLRKEKRNKNVQK